MRSAARARRRFRQVLRRAVLLAIPAVLLSGLLTGLVVPGAMPAAQAASCGTTNLALNKPATASSTENASFTASAAVDGNTGTRWSSAFSDPQWLEVDLGSSQAICQVTLNWEAAYATAFQIQASPDGTTWTTVYSTTGTGGTPDPARVGDRPHPPGRADHRARPDGRHQHRHGHRDVGRGLRHGTTFVWTVAQPPTS